MVDYVWRCHACQASNPAGTDVCAACACAATTSRASLERDLAELQARQPGIRLEATLPVWLLWARFASWLATALGLLTWWVASDSGVSYGGLGLVLAAWLLRVALQRFAPTAPSESEPPHE